MKIKITPLSNKHEHMEGIFKVGNNYYLAKFHSAGIITEVKKSDEWVNQEMAWVSRSEIPFITALRHSQLQGEHLVNGATPFLKQKAAFYVVKEVDRFPSLDECKQLVYKYCDLANDIDYHFFSTKVTQTEIEKLYLLFDYKNNLFIRAGACLHKAYFLLNTSYAFAEEIYINLFIAFECIIEYLKLKNSIERKYVIESIEKLLAKNKMSGVDFKSYEEEMRDYIRNDIIHPFRNYIKEQVAQPFMMADYVFEDLGFVDWLFKQLIIGELK
ncbi:hypothetical protein A3B50_04175 [Candidatus Roizmanbacteria bacterium RIFCSPLOWO2_01_FULL_40_42]|uniref:Uncharacterized protein n=1 Tax=Candidatus Roizmanbacteria bacterium RIFCSPLOWO2_01_FULL_40_42 TaxID=1802066 RepID=A0A1F7J1Y5_9BACT|nr:MAG: hypothetical protein A3C31_04190 [Candidatus Roizmanbacteria bacterium RIFCSPHIGHO2_02_FULL_40_53]OGK29732.1 MAG: hypothetical protein A2W49_04710 [Candidatus Roizmanbacteria bacterium RIFCSPHIGHO2_12_41_18]OGK49621.1 MAG: hypothetical protein A3B50_04175 [Candidatus Roizmanbacteria bacterium RIFCSPLOWO2_01_FULL_40_42]